MNNKYLSLGVLFHIAEHDEVLLLKDGGKITLQKDQGYELLTTGTQTKGELYEKYFDIDMTRLIGTIKDSEVKRIVKAINKKNA